MKPKIVKAEETTALVYIVSEGDPESYKDDFIRQAQELFDQSDSGIEIRRYRENQFEYVNDCEDWACTFFPGMCLLADGEQFSVVTKDVISLINAYSEMEKGTEVNEEYFTFNEPWHVQHKPGYFVIFDCTDISVHIERDAKISAEEKARIERISACINVCAGMTTEDLLKIGTGGIKSCMEAKG